MLVFCVCLSMYECMCVCVCVCVRARCLSIHSHMSISVYLYIVCVCASVPTTDETARYVEHTYMAGSENLYNVREQKYCVCILPCKNWFYTQSLNVVLCRKFNLWENSSIWSKRLRRVAICCNTVIKLNTVK